jgi:hypothetical protein
VGESNDEESQMKTIYWAKVFFHNCSSCFAATKTNNHPPLSRLLVIDSLWLHPTKNRWIDTILRVFMWLICKTPSANLNATHTSSAEPISLGIVGRRFFHGAALPL